MDAFCHALPKVELHAHLSGSVRPSTLTELCTSGDALTKIHKVLGHRHRSLADCFVIFDIIHAVLTTHEAVRRVAREVVEDADADNVRYMELRTTPRAVDAAGMTEASYVDAVLQGVAAAAAAGATTVVRLLLSVNRTEPVAKAERTLALAQCLRDAGRPVVGLDLSGNPTRGHFLDFLPVFERAKAAALRTTIHCAEVMNVAETRAVLAFGPDRLGHMCVLTPTVVAELLAAKRIPIELCPTSNELTLHLPSVVDHPTLTPWVQAHYPIAISTDDSGVFDVTLSSEYEKVATSLALSQQHVACLALRAADFVFCDADTATALRGRMADELAALVGGPVATGDVAKTAGTPSVVGAGLGAAGVLAPMTAATLCAATKAEEKKARDSPVAQV